MGTLSRTRKSVLDLLACCVVLVTSPLVAGTTTARDVRHPDAGNPIVVTDVAGTVSVTTAGVETDVRVDSTIRLPSRIVTGHDGTLGIRQAHTSISIAPDSEIAIPEEAADGQLIARLVQYRGNAFYDVAPREVSKLRVETPYLVAVIKGTQFNVAVQEDSTTISLFEGRLEIHTPDDGEVIMLDAGEIAIRSRLDSTIRVVGMDENRLPTPRAEQRGGATGNAVAAAVDTNGRVVDGDALDVTVPGTLSSSADNALTLDVRVLDERALDERVLDVRLDPSADVGLGANLDLGDGAIGVGLDGVDVGGGRVDLDLDARVDLGFDTGVDLGAGSVDLGLDTGVDLGAGSVDLVADVGLDTGTGTDDVGLDLGLDVDVGDLGLGVDLGVGGDAGLDVGLDLGGDDLLAIELAPSADQPDDGLGGIVGGLLGGLR